MGVHRYYRCSRGVLRSASKYWNVKIDVEGTWMGSGPQVRILTPLIILIFFLFFFFFSSIFTTLNSNSHWNSMSRYLHYSEDTSLLLSTRPSNMGSVREPWLRVRKRRMYYNFYCSSLEQAPILISHVHPFSILRRPK